VDGLLRCSVQPLAMPTTTTSTRGRCSTRSITDSPAWRCPEIVRCQGYVKIALCVASVAHREELCGPGCPLLAFGPVVCGVIVVPGSGGGRFRDARLSGTPTSLKGEPGTCGTRVTAAGSGLVNGYGIGSVIDSGIWRLNAGTGQVDGRGSSPTTQKGDAA
jgi:hypothetical protein